MGRKGEGDRSLYHYILESLFCFLIITVNKACRAGLYFNVNHKSSGCQETGLGGERVGDADL